MSARTYVVNECFHSLQGEGGRAGTPNVFLRFAYCNLECSIAREGFNCDTDFRHGERRSLEGVVALVRETDRTPGGCGWVIVTGGEPTLQLDVELVDALHAAGYLVAIETNGTRRLTVAVDYVAVSPKRGHPCAIDPAVVNECRVVLRAEQELDDAQRLFADHVHEAGGLLYVSPAFYAPPADAIRGWIAAGSEVALDPEALAHCVRWALNDARWRLSLQQHKVWGVR